MKNFKEFLAESKKTYATNITVGSRPSNKNKSMLGFVHVGHGRDFEIHAADHHDIAYYGKNVVRIKGMSTGKMQIGYLDTKKGTIQFYSGNPEDDKDFEKPEKFKAATMYTEGLELMELADSLA